MSGNRFRDLAPRVVSAAVMIVIGGGAVWAGGPVFGWLAVLVSGAMMFELAGMTRGEGWNASVLLGLVTAAVLAVNIILPQPWVPALLALPPVLGLLTPRRDKAVFAGYALVIVLTGLCLVAMREFAGLVAVMWLVSVVVVSDVAGYFAGRILGGPKFWPAISPKKTWSGTIAGWIGAILVGAGFWAAGHGPAMLVWLSPLIAFAGQMGDIVESAIKRRAGVKDASNLIPGHGGLMDRFDALAFAVIAATLLQMVFPFLPSAGG